MEKFISKVYIVENLKEMSKKINDENKKTASKNIGSCKVRAKKGSLGDIEFNIEHLNINKTTNFDFLSAAKTIFCLTKGEVI